VSFFLLLDGTWYSNLILRPLRPDGGCRKKASSHLKTKPTVNRSPVREVDLITMNDIAVCGLGASSACSCHQMTVEGRNAKGHF